MDGMIAVYETDATHTRIIPDTEKIFRSPSKFRWKKSDVSGQDAGRTDDTIMHKNRVGQKRSLSLGWSNITKTEIHEILSAFDPEYVGVRYWDPLSGADEIRIFYTGDMEADVKWWAKGKERYSALNFDVIER